MKKIISSKAVKALLRIQVVFVLMLSSIILTNSCSDDSLPTDEITEEDIAHQKFACEYFHGIFTNKISLSHHGIDQLKKYVADHGNDWGRIGLLPQKVSDNPKEVEMLIQDRTSKELIALFNIEITKMEMKTGSVKVKEFAWYLK